MKFFAVNQGTQAKIVIDRMQVQDWVTKANWMFEDYEVISDPVSVHNALHRNDDVDLNDPFVQLAMQGYIVFDTHPEKAGLRFQLAVPYELIDVVH